jgi:tetratricopeptide (TPR) repeat protein
LAMGLMRLRRFDEALAHLDAAQSLAPGSQGYRGQIYALNGEPAKARQEIRRLELLSREQYVSAYDIATIHATLGDRDDAMTWLQRGYQERSQLGSCVSIRRSMRCVTIRATRRCFAASTFPPLTHAYRRPHSWATHASSRSAVGRTVSISVRSITDVSGSTKRPFSICGWNEVRL